MNKSKLMGYLAAGLLLSNLALISFILFGRRPSAHEGPRDIIIERLHFNDNQVKDYDRLITAHRSAIDQKQAEMLQLKNKLYHTLTTNAVISNDSIQAGIGNIQIEIEKINYNHFRDIRNLCDSSQQQDFNLLVNDIAELFRPMRKHKK